jgi:hypothetical protein
MQTPQPSQPTLLDIHAAPTGRPLWLEMISEERIP